MSDNGALEITHVLAGVSRGDITPQPGLVLQGHWGAPPSRGVLSPLEVRALVFQSGSQQVAVATIDVIGVTRQTTNRIRAIVERACGIPADAVMVVASHTHCAPATLPCMGLQPSTKWVAHVEAGVADCIVRAARTLGPVALGLGCGAATFNMSRRPAANTPSGSEPVDRRARVLRIDREDGSILATIFHYACHATALSGVRGLISADYPGIARGVIERKVGGTALFLPGCGGDLRPRLDDLADDQHVAAARVDACGQMLGDEISRIVDAIGTREWTSVRKAQANVEIPFGVPPPANTLDELMADDTDLGRRLRQPWVRKVRRLIDTRALPAVKATEMQAISVGPLTCLAIPGEPLQAVGRALEKQAASLDAFTDVWPIGYANDLIGYLCAESQYAEGGYEPTAYMFYDEAAPFSGEEGVVLESAARLLGRN